MGLRNAFEEVSTEQTLARLAHVLGTLSHTLSVLSPDAFGRLRVNPEGTSVAASGTVAISSVTANGLVGPTTIQASYDQYGQMMIGASQIRNQIGVS